MYIYPNTDIRILSSVPLNNDYDNVMYFGTLSQQTNYFLGKTKYTLSNQSYQRKERGWLKVNVPQNNLWDCSYLMYRNTSFGTKWFYAFILSVEYVNNETSLINFEIDVMQTWFFDYTLEPCFVEREHSETDELFENTVEEDIGYGNEYNVQTMSFYNLDPTRVLLIIKGRPNPSDPTVFDPVLPNKMGNYFEGMRYISFDLENLSDLALLKNTLVEYVSSGFEDAIVKMCQYPRFMGSITTETEEQYSQYDYKFNVNLVNIDGYIPKNKKLFCYPYNFITVENSLGNVAIFKNEIWNDGTLNGIGNFRIIGTPFGVPQTLCYPHNYRDLTEDYQSGLSLTISIECAWVGDAFQVWLARNQKNLQMDKDIAKTEIYAGAGVAAFSALVGAPLIAKQGIRMGQTGITDLVSNIKKEIQIKNTLSAVPGQVYGHINDDSLNLQADLLGYRFTQNTIRQEYARIIDEYFSRFGYACHRTKVPNRNARQNWTYTKTIGCEINASIPVDDAVKIKQIYDHGVTFWNNPNNIGNFGDFTNPTYS